MKRLFALLVLAALVAEPADSLGRRPPSQLALLPKTEVSVVTAGGKHHFTAWIAADDASRRRGLMYVRSIPADHGMLFLFPYPHRASFWMKDTPLSLDILFISPDGRIANIARDTEPFSLAPIESIEPITAVLEIAAGTALRLGIVAGDRIQYMAIANAR